MTPSNSKSKDHSLITKKLRSLYSSVEAEAVPDRLLDLLEQLDRAEKSATGGKQGSGGNK